MRVVVIGSGLMGLVTAYFLRKSGAEVCVVDRQDSSARETSFANGGMLHASQASPWNAPGVLWTALRMIGREDSALLIRKHALPRMLRWGADFVRNSNPERYAANIERNARLAQYSLSVMSEVRSSESLDYDFSSRGTLTIFRTQSELDAAGNFSNQFAAGGGRFEMIDRTGTIALEPTLAPIAAEISGAMYCPGDESGDAFKFCQELQRACEREGVEFQLGVRVDKLVREGNLIVSADTEKRRLRADKYVLAAGSFSPLLSRSVGLRIPVQPVKGYSITAPIGRWEQPPTIPVIDEHLHAAVCPLGDRLRVAGTAEFAGYNSVLTKSRIDNLFQLLLSLYPEYEPYLDEAATDRWTGLRPVTPAGVGIMGRTAISNLYLNTGHGHLGWTMAAGAGKAVAAEILETESEFDLSNYRLAGA
jgi:D-amino-acid dehydrogenase